MHRCGSRNIVYMNVFDAETRTLLLAFAWLAKQKWLVSFALKVATGSPCNLFVSSSNQHQGASFEPIFVTIGCILVESCFCCCSFLQFLERKKVTSTILKNQPGFVANTTTVPYSKVYQGASSEPVSVTIGSILVKLS